MTISARIARRLRFLADRIDPVGAPRRTGHSFTFEKGGLGIVFRQDGVGCPLWYLGMDDYQRAHDEGSA